MPVLNVRNNLIFPAVLFDSGVQSRVNSLGMPFLGMSDGDRLHQALGIGHQLFRLMFVEGDYREAKGALVRHVIHERVAVGGWNVDSVMNSHLSNVIAVWLLDRCPNGIPAMTLASIQSVKPCKPRLKALLARAHYWPSPRSSLSRWEVPTL